MKAAITAEVAPRAARRHQARRRWHPRNRVPVPGAAADPRWPRAALRERRLLVALDALVAAGQIAPADGALREATCSCAGWRTACRCCATRRPTCCPATRWTARASPSASATRIGRYCARHWPNSSSGSAPNSPRCWPRAGARPRRRAGQLLAQPAEGSNAPLLAEAGFLDANGADQSLRDFAQGTGVKSLSDARLDRVLPALLHAATRSPQPDAALKRVLGLLQAVLRRTSYLALLDEQPSALARLVDAGTQRAAG